MIIINQERTKIINFEKITEITAAGTKILVGDDIFIPKGEEIAKYETKERAKEVLQEIIKAYLDCNVQNVLAEYAYVKNIVFEMPTE
jgi:hypothetical protein